MLAFVLIRVFLMSKVVIIGAGPIGLYLAYKLKIKGITATIYDPRAGVYLRPGHVNTENMEKVLNEINEDIPITKQIHIKDIERVLYDKIQTLYVPIEKKSFIRLSTEGKGIIVANDERIEEFIECDFAFDCTGSKRSVVHAVNNMISPAPFTIKPIVSKVNVKNNVLAYVNMTSNQQRLIDLFKNKANAFTPELEEPLAYARRIEQLRALGWKELGYPKYYSVDFGKDKVCIYMEAPDNLPIELQGTWVQTLLRSMCGVDSISFQQLPSSTKPRFMQFQVYPQEVLEVAHEDKNSPTVIPLGDAQMEPHHRLALGLKSGMRRVDSLIDYIEVSQNNITGFDAQKYFELIEQSLDEHRQLITMLFTDRAEYHENWLIQAKKHYSEAIQKAKKQQQSTTHFEKTLIEINARINYKEAQQLLAELGSADEIVRRAKTAPEHIKFQLSSIYNLLKKTQTNLPESFTEEHVKLEQTLVHLANIWNELGNYYFKKLLFRSAKSMYEKGLAIYEEIEHQEAHPLQELTLYSNLIASKRKLNEDVDIIELEKRALSKYPKNPGLREQAQEIPELPPQLANKSLEEDRTGAGNVTQELQKLGLFKHSTEEKGNARQTSLIPNRSL
jgi:tetratricopeptide (TPR) repeat protein